MNVQTTLYAVFNSNDRFIVKSSLVAAAVTTIHQYNSGYVQEVIGKTLGKVKKGQAAHKHLSQPLTEDPCYE